MESMKWIESVNLTVKSQEEVNSVFTLMNIHIAIQKMKISATSKSFDMPDKSVFSFDSFICKRCEHRLQQAVKVSPIPAVYSLFHPDPKASRK